MARKNEAPAYESRPPKSRPAPDSMMRNASFTHWKAGLGEAKRMSERYAHGSITRVRIAPAERPAMFQSRISALRFAAAGLALGAGLALAGCQTTNPVQVTRFHLAQPIAAGSFSVESVPMAGPGSPLAPDSLELASYGDIVAQELTHYGFTRAASPANSELTVSVMTDRGTRPDPRPGSSVSFGVGGASFGRHTGFGGGVGTTVPIGSRERFIVGTRMMVQIKRHSDGTVIWEGRAMTEAKGQSPDASPQAAVAKLAHALFTGFPGESGRTITVK